jgi:hypothetical protein
LTAFTVRSRCLVTLKARKEYHPTPPLTHAATARHAGGHRLLLTVAAVVTTQARPARSTRKRAFSQNPRVTRALTLTRASFD